VDEFFKKEIHNFFETYKLLEDKIVNGAPLARERYGVQNYYGSERSVILRNKNEKRVGKFVTLLLAAIIVAGGFYFGITSRGISYPRLVYLQLRNGNSYNRR